MINILRIGCVFMMLSSLGCTDLYLTRTSNKVRVYNKVASCDKGFLASVVAVDRSNVSINCTRAEGK